MRMKECPKCKGAIANENGIYSCLNCGYESYNRFERAKFAKANAAEILADLNHMPYAGVLKKWHIASRTLSNLKAAAHIPPRTTGPKPGSHHQAKAWPALPPWSDTWPENVQIYWLYLYDKYAPSKNGS